MTSLSPIVRSPSTIYGSCPRGAVLAELRAECEEGDEPDACLVTALQSYLLKAAPEPAK